jgi:amidase
MSDQLWNSSATDLAQLIRTKQVSSREVVAAHLARIEAVNPKVNAITAVLAESALAAADVADKQEALSPLHGVPFTIKENIDCMGSATTLGVPAMVDALPTRDAPVVARMKTAGAIPLARTNLPELGLRITTDNPLRGRTLNPWTADRTAGGSSGGEGSALATGMSPIGLGNDIGGSLRNPAYCCGITSLKPTTGRIPHAASLPPTDLGLAPQLMLAEGPMARHVKDLKLAYGILSGRDARDPISVDTPLYGPMPAEKRVALVTEIPGVALPDAIVESVKRAGEALSTSGWVVEEALPPELERVTELWGHVLSAEFQPVIDDLAMLMSEHSIAMLNKLFELYDPATFPAALVHAEKWRLSCAWSEFFERYPLVVGPTWTDIPFLHDADIADDGAQLTVDMLRFITPGNVLGIPSVAVPTGVAGGLPTGVQVYADRWREDLCLEGAALIEHKLGRITPIDPRF